MDHDTDHGEGEPRTIPQFTGPLNPGGSLTKSTDEGSIIKSPLDSRVYKSLQLPNGMKVIVISTLELSKSASKSKAQRKLPNCRLKKVFKFNKSYLGLDSDTIKVRCECQSQHSKVLDKATSTTSGLGSGGSSNDELSLTFSEALKAIRELIYGSTQDVLHPDEDEADDLDEDEDISQVASAYLTVGAGWFNDPDDMAGMAHYCEHAVFLGSKKFPAPNQLFRLIMPHEGYVNAYTGGAHTVFAVATSLDIYEVALEILGDTVGFPLLPHDLVSKEIEAIDSEYSLRQEDIPKYFQLLASLAKEGHPLRKMDSGNRETLRVPNFYRKLTEWRKAHYCANYMTLTLEAPLKIEKLEELAMKYFGAIPSSPLPSPRTRIQRKGCPFEMDKFHKIHHIPSVYHSEFMAIHWAFEPTAWKNLGAKPLDYLSSLISHKGEGGLYYHLNYFGWATNVNGGCWDADVTMNQYTSVFSICIDMTDDGFYKQDYILQMVFGYLEMLCQNEPSMPYFREIQRQQADDFHNNALRNNSSFAERASQWLQMIAPKIIIIAPQLTSSFDPDLISEYTKLLQVETCNIMIFSQKFQNREKMNNMEKYYKTPYASYTFPGKLCEKIERLKSPISHIFKLPNVNFYLQEITCSGRQQNNMIRNGPLMVVKGKVSLYYKDDDFRTVGGQLPQSKYTFWFQSPMDDKNKSFTKIHLLVDIFNDMIDSKFSAALSAHHKIQAKVSHGCFELDLIGPSNQLPQVTKDLFKIFTVFEKLLDKRTFEVGKKSYSENLDNIVLDNRWYAWDLINFLWSSHHQLSTEHKEAAEHLNFQEFVQFIKEFKNKMYIVGHLYGYLTTDEAFQVVQIVTQFMKTYPQIIHSHDILLHQCPQFPIGESVIRIRSKNARIHTSVVINGYQFGNLSKKNDDIVNFLARTMSDSAYFQLRTTEQLGYVVIVYHEVSYTVTSLLIELVTQPKNYTTEYCNIRIDKFIADFYNNHISDEEKFTEFLRGKPKTEFSLQDLQHLYLKYLLPNPNTFRKLSIQVVGSELDTFCLAESSNIIQIPDIYLPSGNGNYLDSHALFNNLPNIVGNQILKGDLTYTRSKPVIDTFRRSKSENFPSDANKMKSKLTGNNKIGGPIKKTRRSVSKKELTEEDDASTIPTVPSQQIKDIHRFKNNMHLYPNLDLDDNEEDSS